MITKSPDPERMTVGMLLRPHQGNSYLIPRYQRNYAWGEKEIFQLIQDVEDSRRGGKSTYYIGTLVVHRRDDGRYETIDGQQRLTTLSILMAYLRRVKIGPADSYGKSVILFQSRPNSDEAIKRIFNDGPAIPDPHPGNSILTGYQLVERGLKKIHRETVGEDHPFEDWLDSFTRYLVENVVIFRVQVPQETDLNHYFEVMNSRGEQLEKHEILKAQLMSDLPESDHFTFGKIWEACSNMEKYVQMSFLRDIRPDLFGTDWNDLACGTFEELRSIIDKARDSVSSSGGNGQELSLADILDAARIDDPDKDKKRKDDEPAPDQFHSVINFPNFLIHVLSVHTGGGDIPLDDKHLIDLFKRQRPEKCPLWVRDFAHALLKARLLFDKFVIKRDRRGGNREWSLLRLKPASVGSGSGYVNTLGEESEVSGENKRMLMLQAALHVSNPSASYKYWLLGTLRCLMKSGAPYSVPPPGFLGDMESMARRFVFDVYLSDAGKLASVVSGDHALRLKSLDRGSSYLRYGGIRNNLVFNFLDYLLWLGNPNWKFSGGFNSSDFKFTERSSVEHHSPQNPDDGSNELGEEVHAFGNLYLIDHGKNSRLSNFNASIKRDAFLRSAAADSLKQQFMISYPGNWTLAQVDDHQDKMLDVLEGAITDGLPFTPGRFKVSEKP